MDTFLKVSFDIFATLFFLGVLSSIVFAIVYAVRLIKYGVKKQKSIILFIIISLIITMSSYGLVCVIDNQWRATYDYYMDGHMVVE